MVSVLPEPVGAWISVFDPDEIDSQPWTWASVGAENEDSNQARVAGMKRSGSIHASVSASSRNRY